MKSPELASSRQASRALWKSIAAIALAALAVRTGVVLARHDRLRDDPDGYRAIAANLVEHGVYARDPNLGQAGGELQPTAFRPPLYVLVLAAISPLGPAPAWAVGLLHVVLGAISASLLFVLAKEWGLGKASWLAAALFICDPLLVAQTTEVMTETLATLLVIATLLAATLHRRQWSIPASISCGALLGMSVLCRPTFLPWAILMIVWEASFVGIRRIRKNEPRNLAAGSLILMTAIVIAPWAIRNHLVFGELIPGTTHGGYTLWLGNSDEFYNHLQATGGSPVFDAESINAKWKSSGDELEDDRRLYEVAKQAIESRPRMFLWASGLRVAWLWNPLPHRLDEKEPMATRLVRYATGGWYLAAYAMAAVGLVRIGRRLLRAPWVFALMLCVVVTAVHFFYWSNMRMRAPLEPVVCLLAAAAFVRTTPTSAKGKP